MMAPKTNKAKVASKPPALPTIREVSGPLDPFADRRNSYLNAKDLMMQTCGWIARAWREDDAIEITGVERVKWEAWKLENEDEFRTARILGQTLVFSEIRGVALGITTRRGQAASQKLLLEMLGAKEPPEGKGKKSRADEAAGNLNPNNQAAAMGEFDDDRLLKMAGIDDDGNDTARGTGES